MDELISFLDTIHPLSSGLRQHLQLILKAKDLNKKDFLLKASHVCQNICFIQKGLFRCFYVHGDAEVSSWFMQEGNVIVSVESFFKQKPSYESIQALEDSSVFYIGYHELQNIYRTFPEFNFIARILTENYYTLSEQRLYSLRMQRSHERYKNLLQAFPEIIQRVPAKYIASYLGVAEETLSRIRSKY